MGFLGKAVSPTPETPFPQFFSRSMTDISDSPIFLRVFSDFLRQDTKFHLDSLPPDAQVSFSHAGRVVSLTPPPYFLLPSHLTRTLQPMVLPPAEPLKRPPPSLSAPEGVHPNGRVHLPADINIPFPDFPPRSGSKVTTLCCPVLPVL